MPAVQAVKEKGKNVENIGFENKFNDMILSANGKYLFGLRRFYKSIWGIDSLKGKIWGKELEGIVVEDKAKRFFLDVSADGKYVQLLYLTNWEELKSPGKKVEGEKDKFLFLDGRSGKILRKYGSFKGKFLGEDKLLKKEGKKLKIYKVKELQ